MQTRYKHGGITWVDLEAPSREEAEQVADEFGFGHDVAEELILPSLRTHTESRDGYVYLALHFPALRQSRTSREQEIDFIIGRNFIVTAHYELIDGLHKFSKMIEVNSLLQEKTATQHAGQLFQAMLQKLYEAIEQELEQIRTKQQLIEEHVFAGQEVQMVDIISRNARDLLNLRQAIEPHREVLRSLEDTGAKVFGVEFVPQLRALSDEYFRIHNHVMRATEWLHELREANNSLLTTKQNETMRVLTIMALLTFPLSLMVAIFDINVVDNPFTDVPHGFWLILGSVVLFAAIMLLAFKYKKWL